MEFLTYPSIENLYKTLEVVDHGEVIATEKLHGTNARFGLMMNGKTGGLDFVVGSRNLTVNATDNSAHQGFVGWARAHQSSLEEWFDTDLKNSDYWPIYGVVIYGEFVGKGIQKGVNYVAEYKDFYAFGLTLLTGNGAVILPYDLFKIHMGALGIKTVPVMFRGHVKPEDAIKTFDEIINQPSKVAADNGLQSVMEGVVIQPTIPCLNKFGHPLLAKHKAERFTEVAKAPREVSADDEFIARVGNVFARTFITSERVNHVLDQCRERGEEVKGDMSDMRFLVKAVMADVAKECADALIFLDALVERKKVSKQITRRTSNLYEEMIRAAELEKHLSTVLG